MPRDPRNVRPRLVRFFALLLVAALASAGCGSDSQSGELTPTSKDASRRQKDMYDFMKDRAKDKTASKPAPRNHP